MAAPCSNVRCAGSEWTWVASHATYFWEYSLNQTDWIAVRETMQSKTVISGLPSRTTVFFRFRALTSAGKRDYSQVVSLFVM